MAHVIRILQLCRRCEKKTGVLRTTSVKCWLAVEKRMADHGLNKLSALMPNTATFFEVLAAVVIVVKKNLRHSERQIPVQRAELGAIQELGGRLLPRDLWDRVGGRAAAKELLERRLGFSVSLSPGASLGLSSSLAKTD